MQERFEPGAFFRRGLHAGVVCATLGKLQMSSEASR
jgi:hypothetical protein